MVITVNTVPLQGVTRGCVWWGGALCLRTCCLRSDECVSQTLPLSWNDSNELNKNAASRLPPSCVHYSCEATDCQKLEIDNALLNCTGGGWLNGAQCRVSCQTGYILHVQRDDDLRKSQVCPARFV